MKENPVEPHDCLPSGEVLGLKNVFVIDASAFPSVPGSSVALLTMANAYRIAERFCQDHFKLIMPVSRGSIHHKISADIWALITSFIRPRFYLSPPKSSFRSHAHDCIESYFSSGQNATLFPFARTAFYAVLASLSLPSGTTVLLTPFNIYPMKDIILSMGLNPVVVDINLTDYGPVEQDLVTHLSKTWLFSAHLPLWLCVLVKRIVQLCDFYEFH